VIEHSEKLQASNLNRQSRPTC